MPTVYTNSCFFLNHQDGCWLKGEHTKQQKFSDIWEERHEPSAAKLREIRSIGLMSTEERRERITGPCGDCQWFKICGGGFRTRAAFANDGLWGSDPGCYLMPDEIREPATV